MKLLFIAVPITIAVGWWLSGYDPKLTGQDRNADFSRRAIRCAISVVIVVASWSFVPLWIGASIVLAILWMDCASEFFSRGFHKLVDPADDREFDPAQVSRDLDELAALVKNGQGEQAITLCKKMREEDDGSALAIEAQLFHLYSDVLAGRFVPVSPSLVEAEGLCAQGRFSDAETKLDLLLKREPDNAIAALTLVRIHGRDFKDRQGAEVLLERFARQPQVPAGFLKQARELILEWCEAAAPKEKFDHGVEALVFDPRRSPRSEPVPVENPASVEELLAAGQLSAAIECLDRQLREQPGNFDAWLKLAEAYGFYCRDLTRAAKIVAKMEGNSGFSPEQLKLAKAKLREWQAEPGS